MFRRNGSAEDQRLKAEIEMRNRAILAGGGPNFRGTGPEDAEERIPPITAFELSTLNHFLSAAQSGDFPCDRRAEIPVWPASEMELFLKKYAEWAPSPYSGLPSPAGPFGNMPGPSPPAMFRIMNIISGLNDIMDDAIDFAMSGASTDTIGANINAGKVERSFKLLKTKIWFGLSPVPLAHWNTKNLNHVSNIEEALSILQAVIDVWEYLRQPKIQGQLRNKFNKIFIELDVFQDASNAYHTQRGDPAPTWSISKLWQNYIHDHFQQMETNSRAFLFSHLLALHTVWKQKMIDALQGGRQINSTQVTIKVDHAALMVLNKIQDLYKATDINVRCRTDGFVMAYGVDPRLAELEAPQPVLNRIYEGMENTRVKEILNAFDVVLSDRKVQRQAASPMPEFMEPVNLVVDREFGHKALQPEIENPPKAIREAWVRGLSKESVGSFGYVVYRLTYAQSDEEWETSKKQIEAAIESGWEGVVGAENVKQKAKLHWVDGSEEAILEGDLDAAREHFIKFTAQTSTFPTGLAKHTCLAITPTSILSLPSGNSLSAQPIPGDFTPFLYAIRTTRTEDPPNHPSPAFATGAARPQQEPSAFDGTLKVLAHLLYTDFFAMTERSAIVNNVKELWDISAKHPWGVYTGPTTAVQRRNWREMEALGGIIARLAIAARGPAGG
ncbi:hypothetical protein BGZ60DRAFT_416733 [Tricladium varicosporioides]|nr:hypothetical protein BGZ60DRAFT_416733 [Hymenoscyphus varicosporioides]